MISLPAIKSFVRSIQFTDPRLYEVLIAIIDRLGEQDVDLKKLAEEVKEKVTRFKPKPVNNFGFFLHPTYIRLVWTYPETTLGINFTYEVRRALDHISPTFANSVLVTYTNDITTVVDPLTTGTHYFYIKAIDEFGQFGEPIQPWPVFVPELGRPSLTYNVIDNNVLLFFDGPFGDEAPFKIDHYVLYRNGVLVGSKSGTFTAIFEVASGTYTYEVRAVDVAGNVSPPATTDVTVSQPPDYILQDLYKSDLTHYKWQTWLERDYLVCNVANESWEQHFVKWGYTCPQDQIDDTFPLYVQPTPYIGYYEEIKDYGAEFTALMVNVSFSYEVIVESGHNIVVEQAVSTDGITWTDLKEGPSQFQTNFRYIKIKVTFYAKEDPTPLKVDEMPWPKIAARIDNGTLVHR